MRQADLWLCSTLEKPHLENIKREWTFGTKMKCENDTEIWITLYGKARLFVYRPCLKLKWTFLLENLSKFIWGHWESTIFRLKVWAQSRRGLWNYRYTWRYVWFLNWSYRFLYRSPEKNVAWSWIVMSFLEIKIDCIQQIHLNGEMRLRKLKEF